MKDKQYLKKKNAWKGVDLSISVTLFVIAIAIGVLDFGLNGNLIFSFALNVIIALYLHEMGHVSVAMIFSHKVREIRVMPFGGIWIPSIKHENNGIRGLLADILFYFSGSLLNIFITIYCWATFFEFGELPLNISSMSSQLFWCNLVIGCVNLLPIPPLDMGTLLSSRARSITYNYITKTFFAEGLGIVLTIVALVADKFGLALFFALIVQSSIKHNAEIRAIILSKGMRVNRIMRSASITDVFQHGMNVLSAIELAHRSFQEYFPVIRNNTVVGIVGQENLYRVHPEEYSVTTVAEIMDENFLVVSSNSLVSELVEKAGTYSNNPIIVEGESETFMGVVVLSKIIRSLIIDSLIGELDKVDED